MSELLGGKGTVGVVCHDATSQTGKQRCQGFQDWMKENAPDISSSTSRSPVRSAWLPTPPRP